MESFQQSQKAWLRVEVIWVWFLVGIHISRDWTVAVVGVFRWKLICGDTFHATALKMSSLSFLDTFFFLPNLLGVSLLRELSLDKNIHCNLFSCHDLPPIDIYWRYNPVEAVCFFPSHFPAAHRTSTTSICSIHSYPPRFSLTSYTRLLCGFILPVSKDDIDFQHVVAQGFGSQDITSPKIGGIRRGMARNKMPWNTLKLMVEEVRSTIFWLMKKVLLWIGFGHSLPADSFELWRRVPLTWISTPVLKGFNLVGQWNRPG